MKRSKWQIYMGIILVLLSIIVYIIHYLIFRDMHQIFLYLVQDIAFLFIQVLIVGMIIEGFLNEREKRERMEKIKMVIGAFFSQIGTRLLSLFSAYDNASVDIKRSLKIEGGWTKKEFSAIFARLQAHDFTFTVTAGNLELLRGMLVENRDFLLRILENPTLHEHESFTELLWAIFHLIEELMARIDLSSLPEADMEHLKNDVKRGYKLLAMEWITYMEHLKTNYPYLFSFAIRTNPFDTAATVIFHK